MDMTLHPSDQIVVDLHHEAILQLAVFESTRVQLDFAVKGADLLDFGRDEITFDIEVTDLELVLLDTASLFSTWQVDS